MRFLILFLFALVFAAFCKDFNVMYMRAKFPLHVFNPIDTLHFGPDDFDRRNWNPDEITSMDKSLKNGNSCTPSDAVEYGHLFLPLMKIDFGGGDTGFIVAQGDTNHLWIYEGRNTYVYMYDKNSKGLKIAYELAWGGAGEGPWYETDSWILDLNKDSKPDILTRATGEWGLNDFNGEWHSFSKDTLTAVTWNDTGFVNMKVLNPDSLKKIYKTYFRSN